MLHKDLPANFGRFEAGGHGVTNGSGIGAGAATEGGQPQAEATDNWATRARAMESPSLARGRLVDPSGNMRTFKVRTKRHTPTAQQEQRQRERMVRDINAAHGYPLATLQAKTTQQLRQMHRRIAWKKRPSREVPFRGVEPDRHFLKVLG